MAKVSVTHLFTFNLCQQCGTGVKGMSPEFLEALTSYGWPGKVRELAQVLDSAFSAAKDEVAVIAGRGDIKWLLSCNY